MSDRTFTLDEAQMLLPILESLLKQAIHGKKLIEDVDRELQETAHRVFLNGGTLLNVVHLARRKAERERSIRRERNGVLGVTGISWVDRRGSGATGNHRRTRGECGFVCAAFLGLYDR